MTERNKCLDLGCKALCCSDIYFLVFDESKDDMIEFFGDVKELPANRLSSIKIKGVYFSKLTNKDYLFRIVEMCPKNIDGWCSEYENRPVQCRNFDVGCEECILRRNRARVYH